MKKLSLLLFVLVPFICCAQQSLVYKIRYEKNKFELNNQNKKILSAIADTLIGKTNYLIYINGHADSDADKSSNLELSLKRSNAVKDFFIVNGIDESLIKLQANGEEQPLVENTTPLEKAKNRRVEILILFQQKPNEKIINLIGMPVSPCPGDTTVTLNDGYVVTMSKCDWERNSTCLRIEKKLTYKFKTKENWLKKHIGLKNYKKLISYEPHYEFSIFSCYDSCFKQPIKLYIPQYNAEGLKILEKFSQKKNDKDGESSLVFKKAKMGNATYFTAIINCPGNVNCGFRDECTHLVNLYAKKNISVLSYSYFERRDYTKKDTLIDKIPENPKRFTDNYEHAFFQTLELAYKGDTIVLSNIPIEIFAHGLRKIKRKSGEYAYFMFIPYRKNYKCGHYKKYKIRPKDIEFLKQFRLSELKMWNEDF